MCQLNPFRINTYTCVSKQMTYNSFKILTYAKINIHFFKNIYLVNSPPVQRNPHATPLLPPHPRQLSLSARVYTASTAKLFSGGPGGYPKLPRQHTRTTSCSDSGNTSYSLS